LILVIGASGFIGSALVRHLLDAGKKVRVFVRSSSNFRIPSGKSVEVVVGELSDPRKLEIALDGVRIVYHMIGGEWKGVRVDLTEIEIANIQHLLKSSKNSSVDRIFYLSHLAQIELLHIQF
jgi:dihydroflavonol-4-reductase